MRRINSDMRQQLAARGDPELEKAEQLHNLRLSVFHTLRDGLSALEAFANSDFVQFLDTFRPDEVGDRADFERFFHTAGQMTRQAQRARIGLYRMLALVDALRATGVE